MVKKKDNVIKSRTVFVLGQGRSSGKKELERETVTHFLQLDILKNRNRKKKNLEVDLHRSQF